MTTEFNLKCPHCGSTDLQALDIIDATATITHWTKVGDTFEPAYSGGSEVDWDSQRPKDAAKPFYCSASGHKLALSELVPASAEDGFYVMVDDDTTVELCATLEDAKRVGAAKRDAEPLKARFSIVDAKTGEEIEDLGWSR